LEGNCGLSWWPSCTTEGFEVILFKKERNLEGRAAVLEIQGSSRGLRNW